jgi:hypothetical protein
MAAAALGMVVLLSGCNDINPYLGAAASNSSIVSLITPSSRPAGCPGFTLDVRGNGFVNGAVVNWNNSPRTTNFESTGELLATIAASDVAAQTPVSIVVTTPVLPGQQNQGNNLSNFVSFTIAPTPTLGVGTCPAPPTFLPFIQALNATDINVGQTLEIAGNYFGGLQNTSTVTFNGTAATVTSWSGTLISVTVPNIVPANTLSVSATVLVTVGGVVSTNQTPGANVVNVLPAPAGTGATILNSSFSSANSVRSVAVSTRPRYVAFVAPSPDSSAGAGSGVDKIYLRDTCVGAPGCLPSTGLVSVGVGGTDPNGASRTPSISSYGRFVAFASDASNLVRGDFNGVTNIFLRDTCIGAPAGCAPAMTLISVGAGGIPSNGPSSLPSISPDGRFVQFNSVATNLVSSGQVTATGNPGGVFLWDSCFGASSGCRPSVTQLPLAPATP